jgi:VanZ family protein
LSGFESVGGRRNSHEGDAESLGSTLRPPGHGIEPRFAALTLGIVALIIYGSLFPFVFSERGTWGDAVRYLLATPAVSSDRGDVLSNILLYIPLGLFGARALENVSAGWRVLAMAIFGGALSTGIELTQFFDHGRATELSDLTANFAGALTGALIEVAVRGRFRRTEGQRFAILLLAAGLGSWLYPYVPSFSAQAFRESAAAASSFDAIGTFKQTVLWLAAATILETFMSAARTRIALPLMAAVVILARFAIPGSDVTGSDLIGAGLGVLGWLALVNVAARARIAAALFAGFVIVDALRPFVFLPSPREFGWSPFVSFINGSRGHASRIFLEKTFIYGSLIWLFRRSGLAWVSATLLAAGLVLALRIAQMWIPGRSAEITDVMMVLILAAVMKVLSR